MIPESILELGKTDPVIYAFNHHYKVGRLTKDEWVEQLILFLVKEKKILIKQLELKVMKEPLVIHVTGDGAKEFVSQFKEKA